MISIKQTFYRSLRFCWTTAAVLIIVAAFLVSIARMLMPLLDDYRDDIERLATQQLGRAVHVDKISASWQGLWPALQLEKLRIMSQDGKATWLQADRIKVSLNVWTVIRERRLDPGRILVHGADIRVRRHEDGSFSLNGERLLAEKATEQRQDQLIRWLFSRSRLGLSDSRLIYQDSRYSDHPLEIQNADIHLENSNSKHRIRGSFRLPNQDERKLSFLVELKGDVLKPGEVSNRFYVHGALRVTNWLKRRLSNYINLDQGEVQLQVWGKGSLKSVRHLTAKTEMERLIWSLPGPDKQKVVRNYIDRLKGKMFWHRHDKGKGWSLDVEDLFLSREGLSWPATNMRLVYSRQGQEQNPVLEGRINFIRLHDINALLQTHLPHKMESTDVIRALNLRGDLKDVEFRVEEDPVKKSQYYFKAGFRDFGYNRWKKIPGIDGVDGKLLFNQSRGLMQLASSDTHLDFGKLFRAPLYATDMKGDLFWSHSKEGVRVESRRIDINNKSISSQSRVLMDFPSDGTLPYLDLRVAFQNGVAAKAGDYYPRGIMHPNVVSWLDKGLVNGHVPGGGMLYRGRTSGFPFTREEGTFIVHFNVEDMTLDYQNGWPQAKGLSAEVLFSGPSLLVNVKKADVQGIQVMPSRIKIANLGKKAELELDLHMKGNTSDVLSYLKSSPAGSDFKAFLNKARSKGKSEVKLSMKLPLYAPDKFSLKGSMGFDNSSLKLVDWGRSFEQINGVLDFHSVKQRFYFTSRDMKARFEGSPARLSIKTQRSHDGRALTRVNFFSNLSVQDVLGDDLPLSSDYFKGKSDWEVSLEMLAPDRNRQREVYLNIESRLKGIEINLPDGLGKRRMESTLLKTRLMLGEQSAGPLWLYYQKGINAAIAFRKTGNRIDLDRGEVVLGGDKASLSSGYPGIRIRGDWPRISLSNWLALTDKPGKDKKAEVSFIDRLTNISLKVNEIEVYKNLYHDVSFDVSSRPDYWNAEVKAKEIAGNIMLPKVLVSSNPIVMDMDHWTLNTSSLENGQDAPDPRKFPTIKIDVKKFTLNKTQYGKASLFLKSIEEGISIEKFSLLAPSLDMRIAGRWILKDSWHKTEIKLRAKSDRVGNALTLLGYKANIDEGEGEVVMNASWDGAPHMVDLKRLNGDLSIVIKKGRLRDVNPGGGRIFGLLSLQALPRRLSLDFSDLFKKGLTFDKIEGHFAISDGDAYTNDLYLDGPSVHVDIAGRIGLAARDYDQTVVVIPRITSSMSVLGGLAAGPQVGIGLFLADKLFGKKINKLSAVRYSVTGSWEDPKYQKLGRDENGN
jgi:uncharacterized protein (TIGR02099 family)